MIDCVNNVLVSFSLNIGRKSYPIFEGAIMSEYLILINCSYNVYSSKIIIFLVALRPFIFLTLMPKLFGLPTAFQSLNSFNLELLLFH